MGFEGLTLKICMFNEQSPRPLHHGENDTDDDDDDYDNNFIALPCILKLSGAQGSKM